MEAKRRAACHTTAAITFIPGGRDLLLPLRRGARTNDGNKGISILRRIHYFLRWTRGLRTSKDYLMALQARIGEGWGGRDEKREISPAGGEAGRGDAHSSQHYSSRIARSRVDGPAPFLCGEEGSIGVRITKKPQNCSDSHSARTGQCTPRYFKSAARTRPLTC
jgi:hypothetical protein